MFKYLALFASAVMASDASFCGCGACSLDWLAGSATQQAILLGLSCSNFQQLLSEGTVPPISVSDGEACISVIPQIQQAQVMGKDASSFLGPNNSCPDGLNINLSAADPEEMTAFAEEIQDAWTQ